MPLCLLTEDAYKREYKPDPILYKSIRMRSAMTPFEQVVYQLHSIRARHAFTPKFTQTIMLTRICNGEINAVIALRELTQPK